MFKRKFFLVTLLVTFGASVISLASYNSRNNTDADFVRDRILVNNSNEFIENANEKFDYLNLSEDGFNMIASVELSKDLFNQIINVNLVQGNTVEKVITTVFCSSTDNMDILITISDVNTLLKEKHLNATLVNLGYGEFDAYIIIEDKVILLSELLLGERVDVLLGSIIIGGAIAAAIAAAAAAAAKAAAVGVILVLALAAVYELATITADIINREWGRGAARDRVVDGELVTEIDWSHAKTIDLIRRARRDREDNRFFRVTVYDSRGPRWINIIPLNQDRMADNKRNFAWSSVTADRDDAENVSEQAFLNRPEFPTVYRIAPHTHGVHHFQPVNYLNEPLQVWNPFVNGFRTPHSWFSGI